MVVSALPARRSQQWTGSRLVFHMLASVLADHFSEHWDTMTTTGDAQGPARRPRVCQGAGHGAMPAGARKRRPPIRAGSVPGCGGRSSQSAPLAFPLEPQRVKSYPPRCSTRPRSALSGPSGVHTGGRSTASRNHLPEKMAERILPMPSRLPSANKTWHFTSLPSAEVRL